MTTIGFGDLPTYRPICRAILVFLSLVSVFPLAVVTGVVVAYCNQLIQAESKDSVVKLAYDLEHLEELSKEELARSRAVLRSIADAGCCLRVIRVATAADTELVFVGPSLRALF